MSSSPPPSPEVQPQQWNPSVISLVGVICTALVVISYFKIVKQLCNGTIFVRNQDRRQLLNDRPNPDDSSAQFYSRGLESSIINSLPLIQFKNQKEQEPERSADAECAVCLGEFEVGEWLKRLPNCGHAFHSCCIDTWFQSHWNCPLCRSNVYDLEIPFECSVSMLTLQETLRREDYFHERAEHYHVLRSAVIQTPSLGHEATSTD